MSRLALSLVHGNKIKSTDFSSFFSSRYCVRYHCALCLFGQSYTRFHLKRSHRSAAIMSDHAIASPTALDHDGFWHPAPVDEDPDDYVEEIVRATPVPGTSWTHTDDFFEGLPWEMATIAIQGLSHAGSANNLLSVMQHPNLPTPDTTAAQAGLQRHAMPIPPLHNGLPQATMPRDYQCPHCDASYAKQKTLNRHISGKHHNCKHACAYCGLEFDRTDTRTRHEVDCHERADVQCDRCGKRVGRRSLAAHLMSKACTSTNAPCIETAPAGRTEVRGIAHMSRPLGSSDIDPLPLTLNLFDMVHVRSRCFPEFDEFDSCSRVTPVHPKPK